VKKIRLSIETAAVTFAAWLFPRLPRRIVLLLAQGVGALAYLLDSRGRRTAHENLRAAFAREGITPEQVRRIALGSYQTFARTFIDLFWAARLTKENFHDFVHIRLEDASAEELARQRGGIWVTPHFGNFEMISYVWGFRGVPFVVVAQDFDNPSLTAIFTRLRRGSGHSIIPPRGAMLRLKEDALEPRARGAAHRLEHPTRQDGGRTALFRTPDLLHDPAHEPVAAAERADHLRHLRAAAGRQLSRPD
jgi:lauroyl/myristoyl acyltransferase